MQKTPLPALSHEVFCGYFGRHCPPPLSVFSLFTIWLPAILSILQITWNVSKLFDATKGYPGEGPPRDDPWNLFSANIGSIKTATSWKTWNSDITCTQETRIGKNCINNAKHSVAQCGKTLFPGALLPGLFASNGVMRTPHGGVAIAAPAELCTTFLSKDDNTGKFAGLYNTKRVQAVWIQITPLVFNVYCKTAASQDRDVLHYNDCLLADIFAVASQFGDIPVFIAGDLQTASVRIRHMCH